MRGTDFYIGGKTLWEMDAAHLMERDVISFNADTSCHNIAETMTRRGFGGVPIVDDEGCLTGIVTEYDLLNALNSGLDLRKTPAKEVMSEPIYITPKMSTEEIITFFQTGHLIRIPVVNIEGKLIGIVTRRDILAGYLESNLGPLPVF